MAVDFLNDRLLSEPNVAGVTTVDAVALKWVQAPADEAPMGYWRKPSDGYVFLAMYGENGTERKLDRGFVRLGARYGTYDSAAMAVLADPLLGLVMRGGLDQLPPRQIRELGWHRVPDRAAKRSHRQVHALVEAAMAKDGLTREQALVAVMPQLQGVDLTDHYCALCPGRIFISAASKTNHDTVMHREQVQSTSIGQAVAAAQGGAGSNDVLLSLIAQQGDLIANLTAKIDALETTKAPKGKKADPPTD